MAWAPRPAPEAARALRSPWPGSEQQCTCRRFRPLDVAQHHLPEVALSIADGKIVAAQDTVGTVPGRRSVAKL